jgi:hypothetical protein
MALISTKPPPNALLVDYLLLPPWDSTALLPHEVAHGIPGRDPLVPSAINKQNIASALCIHGLESHSWGVLLLPRYGSLFKFPASGE